MEFRKCASPKDQLGTEMNNKDETIFLRGGGEEGKKRGGGKGVSQGKKRGGGRMERTR